MVDAMDAFEKVSTSARLPIILLFTKIDIFKELLSTYKFTDYYPDYSAPMSSSNFCLYLASLFQRLHVRSDKRLFIRVVNAAEPEAFRKVFEEIESQVLGTRPVSTLPWCSDDLWFVDT